MRYPGVPEAFVTFLVSRLQPCVNFPAFRRIVVEHAPTDCFSHLPRPISWIALCRLLLALDVEWWADFCAQAMDADDPVRMSLEAALVEIFTTQFTAPPPAAAPAPAGASPSQPTASSTASGFSSASAQGATGAPPGRFSQWYDQGPSAQANHTAPTVDPAAAIAAAVAAGVEAIRQAASEAFPSGAASGSAPWRSPGASSDSWRSPGSSSIPASLQQKVLINELDSADASAEITAAIHGGALILGPRAWMTPANWLAAVGTPIFTDLLRLTRDALSAVSGGGSHAVQFAGTIETFANTANAIQTSQPDNDAFRRSLRPFLIRFVATAKSNHLFHCWNRDNPERRLKQDFILTCRSMLIGADTWSDVMVRKIAVAAREEAGYIRPARKAGPPRRAKALAPNTSGGRDRSRSRGRPPGKADPAKPPRSGKPARRVSRSDGSSPGRSSASSGSSGSSVHASTAEE
jgi:hypothetical protein